jgi:hypothetical protein
LGRSALLAVVGLGLVAWLLHGAGPARVAHVLWQARSWIPLIVALELAQALGDVVTLRSLLGRDVPRRTWLRSSAVAYAMMILVPAGRAAGEVARAALLSRQVGATRAACASMQLQSAYVFAIGLVSGVEYTVVASRMGAASPLALLLAANAVLMVAFSSGLLAIQWNARLGRWLERLLRRLSHGGEDPPTATVDGGRRIPWRQAAICVASRTAQVIQYGVILQAVGGQTSIGRAFVTHGIHLVAATVGDVLPNGLGIVDGTYRTFAAEVGFAGAPERALSIAFVAHLAQLIVATAAVITLVAARGAWSSAAPGEIGKVGNGSNADKAGDKAGDKQRVRASPAE